MKNTGLTLGAWSGPIGLGLFGIGIGPIVAHFLPPPAPTLTALQVAALFRDHALQIRVAAVFLVVAASFFGAFAGAITALLRRIEGSFSPYAYMQLVGGMLGAVVFLLSPLLWAAAAFRPERDPSEVMLLNDLGWMVIVMPGPLGVLQLVPIALAILSDESADPLLPRWLGFLSLWTAVLFMPGCFIIFFKQGLLAWDGLIGFWLPAVAFTIWIAAMCTMMIKVGKTEHKLRHLLLPEGPVQHIERLL